MQDKHVSENVILGMACRYMPPGRETFHPWPSLYSHVYHCESCQARVLKAVDKVEWYGDSRDVKGWFRVLFKKTNAADKVYRATFTSI